jgi:hypothetical protein
VEAIFCFFEALSHNDFKSMVFFIFQFSRPLGASKSVATQGGKHKQLFTTDHLTIQKKKKLMIVGATVIWTIMEI